METATNLYLFSIVLSLLIMVLIIYHEDEFTVKDLLSMILVMAIPILNVIIYALAIAMIDREINGPISKTIKFLNKFLNINLKK
ncbi:hypothetical protein [Chryseobacterium sp. R2A-55]|uniref:hypothetical protein n=1 Tax=Chryseobacterium sp. R2A-55 TaxID=2744445 RepID=UPI001F463E2D|nr:hypothetical protein [Chryseobacterium sp. R2A-55]